MPLVMEGPNGGLLGCAAVSRSLLEVLGYKTLALKMDFRRNTVFLCSSAPSRKSTHTPYIHCHIRHYCRQPGRSFRVPRAGEDAHEGPQDSLSQAVVTGMVPK